MRANEAGPTRGAALSSTKLGKNPASVLPAPVGAISSTERPTRAFAKSSSWCARGVQPRLANQRRNGSGRSEVVSSTVWTFMTVERSARRFVAS